VIRGWLRRLGIDDESCPVGVGNDPDGLSEEMCRCMVPENLFPANHDGNYHLFEGGGHGLILNMASKYRQSLSIIAIGPLRALMDAVMADDTGVLQQIGGFFFQGSAQISDDGVLTADPIAYNVRVGQFVCFYPWSA
jgi:hypothetical protein